MASLQRWIDTDRGRPWIERRRAQTDARRDRFLLEGEPSEGELIREHAVVGFDPRGHRPLARRHSGAERARREPRFAGMYRDIIRTQPNSFVSSALLELRDCATAAYRGPKDMRAWAGFCHARFDRLKDRSRVAARPPANWRARVSSRSARPLRSLVDRVAACALPNAEARERGRADRAGASRTAASSSVVTNVSNAERRA